MFDICLVASSGANWEQQWSFVLSNFKPRHLYVIGKVDRKVRPFRDYIAIENAEEITQDLVLAAPVNGRYYSGETSLMEFNHPEECCYLFGSDNWPLSQDQMGNRTPQHSVYVPVDTIDTMYSFMAGAIILYDRKMKYGQPDHG